mmetsp:Transcript_54488/g.151878  ORF Transcript_54488/g.151878 Transcript_54488/m.151878 type:complete len:219 (+) Transcript_54488:2155-2811(+)
MTISTRCSSRDLSKSHSYHSSSSRRLHSAAFGGGAGVATAATAGALPRFSRAGCWTFRAPGTPGAWPGAWPTAWPAARPTAWPAACCAALHAAWPAAWPVACCAACCAALPAAWPVAWPVAWPAARPPGWRATWPAAWGWTWRGTWPAAKHAAWPVVRLCTGLGARFDAWPGAARKAPPSGVTCICTWLCKTCEVGGAGSRVLGTCGSGGPSACRTRP